MRKKKVKEYENTVAAFKMYLKKKYIYLFFLQRIYKKILYDACTRQ